MISSVLRLIRAFVKKINADGISALSAHAAFFVIISFFPFVMFLLTLLSYLPFFTETLPAINLNLLPGAVSAFIIQAFTELSNRANGTILSITVIIAIWSASRGILSVMRGLNSIHNVRETRNYFVTRIMATLYTVVFAVLLLVMMLIFIFGNQLTLWLVNRVPVLGEFALVIISLRTAVGIAVLIFFFLIIFLSLPNRKTTILRELPGAVLTAAGWVGFSFLFSFYVDNLSNYTAIYGSLTAIVLCMLWLYACMYILFIGAEVNSILSNPAVRKAALALLKKQSDSDSSASDTSSAK